MYEYYVCFRIQDIARYQPPNWNKYFIEFGKLKLAIPIHQLHNTIKTFFENGTVEGVDLSFRASLLHLDKDKDEWTFLTIVYIKVQAKLNSITELRAILCSDLCKELEVVVQFNEADPKVWIYETRDENERRALFFASGRRKDV